MSWKTVTLGEIIELQNGFAFKSSEYAQEGYFLMRITNVQQGFIQNNNPKYVSIPESSKLKQFILNKGDILMSLTGDVGRVGVLKESNLPAALNQRVARVIIKSSRDTDKSYIFNLLNSETLRNKIESLGHGAAQLNVSTKDILSIQVPFPPLQIQQKIVTKLEVIFTEIDKAMAATEANAKNAEALFQSYLTEVFEKIKDESMSVKFSELATFRNGINFRTSSTGIPKKIFGVRNFKNFFFAPINDLDLINLEKNLPKEDLIQSGDILFVRSNGNSELIGRCVLFENVVDEITFSGFTIRSRLISKNLYPKFLMYFLKSEKTRRKMIDGGNGANIKSLNQTTLSSLDIPLPVSIEIQKKITKRFEQLEIESVMLSNSYKSKKLNLDVLKKSILTQAFNGELVKD